MKSPFTRRVVTAVAITAGAALLMACVLVGAGADSSAAAPPPTARGAYSLDFIRVLQLVADLRAQPPASPLVCLLGGSSARECTISNGSWSDRVSSLRGYRVKCVNLGSKHRRFTQDRRIVGYLPEGTDIVYVGVNVGRFCNGPVDPPVILPEPSGAIQHRHREGLGASLVTGRRTGVHQGPPQLAQAPDRRAVDGQALAELPQALALEPARARARVPAQSQAAGSTR